MTPARPPPGRAPVLAARVVTDGPPSSPRLRIPFASVVPHPVPNGVTDAAADNFWSASVTPARVTARVERQEEDRGVMALRTMGVGRRPGFAGAAGAAIAGDMRRSPGSASLA